MPLSPQQLTQLAYNAGFRGSALRMSVAIAIAESAGNPRAYNPELAAGTKKGSGSRGLWQIYGAAHPEFNSDALFDPQYNARAAYKVYQQAGNSFRPWTTFTKGIANPIAAGLNINTSSQALSSSSPLSVPAIGGGLTQIGGSGTATSLGTITAQAGMSAQDNKSPFNIQLFPDRLTQIIEDPNTPMTILLTVLGAGLIFIGLIILIVTIAAPVAIPAIGGVGKIAVAQAIGNAIES